MNNAFQRIIRFVLAQAEHQPIAARAQIYDDLALICGDEQEAEELRATANRLREASQHLEKVQLRLFSETEGGKR